MHASGSAGTQAGLLAGLLALGHSARVIGIDVDAQAARVAADVRRVGREAAALLGVSARWDDACVDVAGAWCGRAYGVPDATTDEAIALGARSGGSRAGPGLCRQGLGRADRPGAGRIFPGRGDTVVWIHTGGAPGIFAYPNAMARAAALDGG